MEIVGIIAKWIVTALLTWSFFSSVHKDFNGTTSRSPNGFQGFIITVISTAIVVGLFVLAGTFDGMFGR